MNKPIMVKKTSYKEWSNGISETYNLYDFPPTIRVTHNFFLSFLCSVCLLFEATRVAQLVRIWLLSSTNGIGPGTNSGD